MSIPSEIAAAVLFRSDRTCCVCREKGRPVQVHHLDENPKNNRFDNLAVLCTLCHGETHSYGGFCRRLDAAQIALYRDEWVAKLGRLIREQSEEEARISDESKARVAASLLAQRRYDLVARHFHLLRRFDLRDMYVERALREMELSTAEMIALRVLQGRADAIPTRIIEEFLDGVHDQQGLLQVARWQRALGRNGEATATYCHLIVMLLTCNEVFAAAACLKELMQAGMETALFHEVYGYSSNRDLWTSVRCLQELNWHSELKRLLEANRTEIENGKHLLLRFELFRALRETEKMNATYVAMYEEVATS